MSPREPRARRGEASVVRPDTNQLKVLSHPMRLRILGLLRTDGPATASGLAQRLGLNSGATSYHLRQLAKNGLIVDDEDRGNGRDRWWRAAHDSTDVDVSGLDDPADREAVGAFNRTVVLHYIAQLQASLDERLDLPRPWADAIDDSDWNLWLTPDQARDALARIHAVMEDVGRQAALTEDAAPDGAAPFAIQIHGFPRPGKIAEPGES